MGRLIDADKIYPDVMTKRGALAISQGQLAYAPAVEAIPKDQYEARLKADLVAMLDEIDLELAEQQADFIGADDYNESYGVQVSRNVIREKINALKEENNGNR